MNMDELLEDNLFYHLKQKYFHFHYHTMLVLLKMTIVKNIYDLISLKILFILIQLLFLKFSIFLVGL